MLLFRKIRVRVCATMRGKSYENPNNLVQWIHKALISMMIFKSTSNFFPPIYYLLHK